MPGFFDSLSNIGSSIGDSLSNLGSGLFDGASDFFGGATGGFNGNVQSNSTNTGGIFNPGATASFNQTPGSLAGRLGQGLNNNFSSNLLFGQNGSQGLLNGGASIYNDFNRVKQGNEQIGIAKAQLTRNNALEDKNRASAVAQANNKFRVNAQNSPFFSKLTPEEQDRYLQDNIVA